MDGEVIFYDWETVKRSRRGRATWPEMTSALGRIYEEWNAANVRAREAYEARNRQIEREERTCEAFWRARPNGVTTWTSAQQADPD